MLDGMYAPYLPLHESEYHAADTRSTEDARTARVIVEEAMFALQI